MACDALHPEHPGLTCIATATHAEHVAFLGVGMDREPIDWPNPDYRPPASHRSSRGDAAQKLRDLGSRVPPAPVRPPDGPRPGTDSRPPVVGNGDPWTSHVAAELIEPTRGTRKHAVLTLLREAQGGWVNGSEIATQEVGGSEGLRRLRELREADGWVIERRPAPGMSTSWQYRLGADA